MPTVFDHLEAGTPEASWRLDDLPRIAIPGADARLLIVAAHPDDESLGAGGLIAAANCAVTVVIASDGEASHPHSSTHVPAQLARVRRREAVAAVEALAPSATVVFLGLPDGELAAYGAELTAAIEGLAKSCTHVISPWRGDRHPDHQACADAVRRLDLEFAHWQYPIWAWHWADPSTGLPHLYRVDLEPPALAAKSEAIAAHRSQHAPLSTAPGDEAILSAPFLAHFGRSFETFIIEPVHPAGHESYFAALYDNADDPWELADRFYETRKRELLLASLPRPRFRRAFEPGCATGLLTARLAERCDEVVAWDGAAAAVRQTRARNAAVIVEQRRIPTDWPTGEFDLVVLSEIGYYCADPAVLAARILGCLATDGVVVACHWRHPAVDHPQSAYAVHAAITASGLRSIARHNEADFLLEVWSRSGESVAQAEGIVT